MPELPDVESYLTALRSRVAGELLEHVRVRGVSVLKTYDPPLEAAEGRIVGGVRRLGKRVVVRLDEAERPEEPERLDGRGEPGGPGRQEPLWLIIHLMIAGRLWWKPAGAAIPRRYGLAALDFGAGTLLLTEAGTTRRASLHLERGAAGLARHDPGGLEPLEAEAQAFAAALRRENHTLKRALTDQRIVAGIGNAYSDEILHRAGMSPLQRTANLDDGELQRLHRATTEVLATWVERLREQAGGGWPQEVTAFREGFAVHGRYGRPCPACGTEVQRISYAERETNYCPRCQTGGRLLADRALSRLLKDDWPASVDELEG